MLSRSGKKVYYYSCQVTKDPCTCRSIFGADAHHSVIPTCSSLWTSGDEFKQRFDAVLRENYGFFRGHDILPVWFEKTWQPPTQPFSFNRSGTETSTIGTMASHHIVITVRHTRMENGDPITSFSFGRGGILSCTSSASQQAVTNPYRLLTSTSCMPAETHVS